MSGARSTPQFEPTQAELKALLRATSDVVLVLDGDGRYVRVAPSARNHLYRPPEELLGRRLADVLPADVAERFHGVVRRAIDTGDVQEHEYPLQINDTTVWFHATVSPTGEGTVVWVARDVTTRRASEHALRESEARFRTAAERDELTGVYNRRGFLNVAESRLGRARGDEIDALLVFADLDDLKPINDRYGHAAGDAVLRAAADVLRRTIRGEDVLGRLGGDEFATLIVPSGESAGPHRVPAGEDRQRAAERSVRERLARNIAAHNANASAKGSGYQLSLSIGVACLPLGTNPAETLRDLLHAADDRLYAEKRERKLRRPR